MTVIHYGHSSAQLVDLLASNDGQVFLSSLSQLREAWPIRVPLEGTLFARLIQYELL